MKKKKRCKRPSENPYYYNPDFKAPGKRRGKKGRKAVLSRTRHRDFVNARRGESYQSRNLILKELGFASYKDYLKSPLWKRIREEVLKRDRNVCQICSCHANQVHHSRYHRNDLLGKNKNFLHSLCGQCHEKIEFKKGEKVWMDEAKVRLKSFQTMEEKKKEIEREYEQKFGFLDEEFDRIFKNF